MLNTNTGFIPVKIINGWAPYAAGDIAGFTPSDAAQIVDRGLGAYHDPHDDHRGGKVKQVMNRALGRSPEIKSPDEI